MSEQPPVTQSSDTNRSAYDVADAVPIEGFDAVSAGTNVLVSGPPQSGKTRLALRLLARGTAAGEQAIAVTADLDGTRLRQRFEAVDGDPSRLHVVDCSGASGKESFDDAEGVRYVSSPADLTGIGLGVVKYTRQVVADADSGVRLSTLSLSTDAPLHGDKPVVRLPARPDRPGVGSRLPRRLDGRPDGSQRRRA